MPQLPFELTGEQIRAARALTRIEQRELAARTRLSVETIKRLEGIRGRVDANVRTLTAIASAFEAVGLAFEAANGEIGVRLNRREPPPVVEASALYRLIYHSVARTASKQSSREAFDQILVESRRRNAALGVTGALLSCDGRYLQHLEGPKSAVLEIFGSILTDPRHETIVTVESRPVSARLFPSWSMCSGLVLPADIAKKEPALADGFQPERLSPSEASGLLVVARDYSDPRTATP